jgi:uncharacterized protein with GYD domain
MANRIEAPEDRREAVGWLIEAVGGKLLAYWYAFRDQDGYVLGKAPDNTAVACALVTVAGSGGCSQGALRSFMPPRQEIGPTLLVNVPATWRRTRRGHGACSPQLTND